MSASRARRPLTHTRHQCDQRCRSSLHPLVFFLPQVAHVHSELSVACLRSHTCSQNCQLPASSGTCAVRAVRCLYQVAHVQSELSGACIRGHMCSQNCWVLASGGTCAVTSLECLHQGAHVQSELSGACLRWHMCSQSFQLLALNGKCTVRTVGWVQVRNLRERLEEEHQALLTREQDKAALELRIARLTKLILHSTRITSSTAAARKQRISLLRSFSEHLCPTVSDPPPFFSPTHA